MITTIKNHNDNKCCKPRYKFTVQSQWHRKIVCISIRIHIKFQSDIYTSSKDIYYFTFFIHLVRGKTF